MEEEAREKETESARREKDGERRRDRENVIK